MNSKKNKLIAITLIVIIVDIIGVIVLMIINFNNKNNNDATESNTTSNNTNINNPDKDNPKDEDISDNNDNDKIGDEESRPELYVYRYKDDIIGFYYIKSIGDEESLNKIKEWENNHSDSYKLEKIYKCSHDNCEFMSGYDNNILIYDGEVYLYNMIDDNKKKIDISVFKIDEVKYENFRSNNNFILMDNLIVYKKNNNDKYSIYSIKDSSIISNEMYDSIEMYDYESGSTFFCETGIFIGVKHNKDIEYNFDTRDILDSKTGKINYSFMGTVSVLFDKLNYYYINCLPEDIDHNNMVYYTSNFEMIASGGKSDIYNGNLVIENADGKSYSIYNNANLIYESKNYDKILDFVDGYFIAIEGGKLHVISLDETTNILICDWLEEYIYPGVALLYDDTIELGYWLDKEGNEGVTYKYNFKTNKLEYKNEPMQWTI